MEETVYSDRELAELREAVKPYLKPKRYAHTLAVEEEAAALADIFMPGDESFSSKLRAAALLHDITKKLELESQLQICSEFGIIIGEYDTLSPKVFHAKTAAAIIPRDFPDFADESVIRAVRLHTTGAADMKLADMLLYLADYIEPTRSFGDCIELRKIFYNKIKKAENESERLFALCETLVLSFDMTLRGLIEDGAVIARETTEARNHFIAVLAAR